MFMENIKSMKCKKKYVKKNVKNKPIPRGMFDTNWDEKKIRGRQK